MKYLLDTNVIISHFKGDRFSDDTDSFFAWVKNAEHEIYISDIVYAELYTGYIYQMMSQMKKNECSHS